MWRWVGLRSAGFPVDRVLRLGRPAWLADAAGRRSTSESRIVAVDRR